MRKHISGSSHSGSIFSKFPVTIQKCMIMATYHEFNGFELSIYSYFGVCAFRVKSISTFHK
jgi:hypothetical protein